VGESENGQHDGDTAAGFKHLHHDNADVTGDRHCLCIWTTLARDRGRVVNHLPDEAKGP
jgi:hypothetical protein